MADGAAPPPRDARVPLPDWAEPQPWHSVVTDDERDALITDMCVRSCGACAAFNVMLLMRRVCPAAP